MTREQVLSVACPMCRRKAGRPCASTPGQKRVRIGVSAWSRIANGHVNRDPDNRGQRSVMVHQDRIDEAGGRWSHNNTHEDVT